MPGASPSPHGDRIVACLKDGFWESTCVVRKLRGELVVRKQAKPEARTRPWALGVLRAEIDYLANLPPHLREHFPPLRRAWGATEGEDNELPGYEIPFYPNARDLGHLVADGVITRDDALGLQEIVARIIFDLLHQPADSRAADSLSRHVADVLDQTAAGLRENVRFRPVVLSPEIRLNGAVVPGIAASLERIRAARAWRERLDAVRVRVHGDLIPENVLWDCEDPGSPRRGRIILVDPVSVAGIREGHPLFDLVKYESYASGLLYAIRRGEIDAGPVPWRRPGEYRFRLRRGSPGVGRLVAAELAPSFRAAYAARHGPVDPGLHSLLEGYFSLVMALNTSGRQQWARVLEGTRLLHLAADALYAA